jgi:hypothetical protein
MLITLEPSQVSTLLRGVSTQNPFSKLILPPLMNTLGIYFEMVEKAGV